MAKIVIVGGVAGGASAAARARRIAEDAEIIVLERGEFVSFANCGLPYHIGGEIETREALLLQTPESFKKRFNVDVRVFSEVTDIDPATKVVTIKRVLTGETYQESYDKLLLSPGASPIKPPIPGISETLALMGSAALPLGLIETTSFLAQLNLITRGNMIGVMPQNIAQNYEQRGMLSILPYTFTHSLSSWGSLVHRDRHINPVMQRFLELMHAGTTV